MTNHAAPFQMLRNRMRGLAAPPAWAWVACALFVSASVSADERPAAMLGVGGLVEDGGCFKCAAGHGAGGLTLVVDVPFGTGRWWLEVSTRAHLAPFRYYNDGSASGWVAVADTLVGLGHDLLPRYRRVNPFVVAGLGAAVSYADFEVTWYSTTPYHTKVAVDPVALLELGLDVRIASKTTLRIAAWAELTSRYAIALVGGGHLCLLFDLPSRSSKQP